jgi:hypothetical protein
MTLSCFPRLSMVGLVSVFLVTLIGSACNSSSSKQPSVSAHEVFVIFDGPWAFAADPKDANSIIAIAPKTEGHRDLFVQSHEKILMAGVYDLMFPPRIGPASGTVDSNILRTKIDALDVQRVLDDKTERYAIRLPKPEAYLEAEHFRSRAGASYPPDASTENDYVTSVSLRYNVATLSGFSLAGAPDSGYFGPLPLPIETPMINFAIDPDQADDLADLCCTHSRESFRDLTKLLNVTLFVDFPHDSDKCHYSDPQNTRVKTEKRRLTTDPGRPREVKEASVAPSWIASVLAFTSHVGNCKAPVIVGN